MALLLRRALPLLLAHAVTGSAELSVDVYEGSKDCIDIDRVKKGDLITVHYTGKIDATSATGVRNKRFDSTEKRGSPFQFVVGIGEVLKGWDEGLIGLCLGSKATLVLPPEYGYGDKGGAGGIPGRATLHYDVEIVEIGTKPAPRNVFTESVFAAELEPNSRTRRGPFTSSSPWAHHSMMHVCVRAISTPSRS